MVIFPVNWCSIHIIFTHSLHFKKLLSAFINPFLINESLEQLILHIKYKFLLYIRYIHIKRIYIKNQNMDVLQNITGYMVIIS